MSSCRGHNSTWEGAFAMDEPLQDHTEQDHMENLQLLSQLAREYHQKSTELEAFLKDLEPRRVCGQLILRSEMTTNNFRIAQQALFNEISSKVSQATLRSAAMALCRCFDEMRILFNAMAAEGEKEKG